MGYRYRTQSKVDRYRSYQKWVSGSSPFSTIFRTTSNNDVTKEMQDFVIPGFSKGRRQFGRRGYPKMVKGRYSVPRSNYLPINPLHYIVDSVSEPLSTEIVKDSNGARTWTAQGNLTQFWAGAWSAVFPTVSFPRRQNDEELLVEAKRKALGKFNKPRYSFGEPIAELRKTVLGIKPMLYSIDRSTRFLLKQFKTSETRYLEMRRALGKSGSRSAIQEWRKSEDVRLAKEYSDRLSDHWLSYAMAVRPSIQSVGDAISAYWEKASSFTEFPERETALGFANFQDERSALSGPFANSGWTNFRETVSRVEVSVKAGIFYEIFDHDSRTRFLGVRPGDWVVTGWQVLPYSFLIDRMFDVRSFLHAGMALLDTDIKIISGFTTTRRTTVTTKRFIGRRASGSNLWTPQNSTPVSYKRFVFARTRWTPELSDAIPRFKPVGLVDNITKVLDVSALVIKRLQSRPIASYHKT